ncbi:MAG: hypothetical protein LUG91_10935 [Ruminococcus sp.]|nr:hypothetical protein [Ruminococcus sp.]
MRNKTAYIVIAILFVLFHVVVFTIPMEKTACFWVAYGFSVLSFFIVTFSWKISAVKKSLQSLFLGIPVFYVSVVYCVLQLLTFVVFMIVNRAPVWAAVLVCSLILGISCICMITTKAGAETIADTEVKVAAKRKFIKDLQIEVELLAEKESDKETKEKLFLLAKKIRLSDPMSDESLSTLEEEIFAIVENFCNSTDKNETISEVERLLLRRNKQVMDLKG